MERASSLPRTRPASSEASVPSVERVARRAERLMEIGRSALTRREALARAERGSLFDTDEHELGHSFQRGLTDTDGRTPAA